jgi:predicted DCC family thiol-disulfide oxidoreductase YuxK
MFLVDSTLPRALSFAALQSEFARSRFAPLGLSQRNLGAAYLLQDQRMYAASDAILRSLSLLDTPVKEFSVLRYLPRPLRDAVYFLVARIRRRIGVHPIYRQHPAERARFIA